MSTKSIKLKQMEIIDSLIYLFSATVALKWIIKERFATSHHLTIDCMTYTVIKYVTGPYLRDILIYSIWVHLMQIISSGTNEHFLLFSTNILKT